MCNYYDFYCWKCCVFVTRDIFWRCKNPGAIGHELVNAGPPAFNASCEAHAARWEERKREKERAEEEQKKNDAAFVEIMRPLYEKKWADEARAREEEERKQKKRPWEL